STSQTGGQILLDNIRSMGNPVGSGIFACNGTSNWDQNSGPNGYPCRDQIGRSRDKVQWSIGAAYNQALNPAYFWLNKQGTNNWAVDIDGACGSPWCLPSPGNNPTHLVANRDWYTENATCSPNGCSNLSTGVGSGTLSQRPTLCTTGTAYWATDQGEWNSLQAGPDGPLYKCTRTKTRVPYNTPFTSPHPPQTGRAVPPPPPPPAPPDISTTTPTP